MKGLYCFLLVLLSAVLARADGSSLKEGRQRWLHGNYEEAQSLYEKLPKDAKQRIPATVGLSQTLQSQGEYDKALEVLDAGIRVESTSADLHARRAEVLYCRGRWSEAEQAAGGVLLERARARHNRDLHAEDSAER